MRHAVIAHLKSDSGAARKELRGIHLAYIDAHKASIVAGGPTLTDDGQPLTMILLTCFETAEEARAFMAAEPYNASGRVFEQVEVLAWSQVLPELTEGALQREVDKEKG